ncbi:MAG TPA: YtxH domain-containing protein [Candidatus Saccharimonadales bacterium]|jgi:gas vesicle protein|nr:YtxH domain-containing protein [Candidatus Saccharimonadales bacterium]
MGKTAKRIAIGATIAAVGGYIAGILTAPKSGKETREDIKNKALQTYTEAEKELKKLHTQLADVLGQVKDKADDLTGKARSQYDDIIKKSQETKDKVRELLSSLHEGDADDKDLKKAIQDAEKSIDNLKAFLKK